MQLGERGGIHRDLHHLAASELATAPLCLHDRSLWLQPTLTSSSAPTGSTEVRVARTRKSGKELAQLRMRAGRGARSSKSAKSPSALAHHTRRALFLRCLPVAAGMAAKAAHRIQRGSGEEVP